METFDLLVAPEWTPGTDHWREGWSTAMMRPGGQSVTTTLIISMLKSSVDKLVSQQVSLFLLLNFHINFINVFFVIQMVLLHMMEVSTLSDELPLVSQCI